MYLQQKINLFKNNIRFINFTGITSNLSKNITEIRTCISENQLLS